MSNSNEKYIGESLIREEPGKKLKLKIAEGAVTTKKIADDAVVTSKLKDKNVTESKIANGAISYRKLNQAVQQELRKIPTTIYGDVTNAPDDEDLTSVIIAGSSRLRLKDRTALLGKGYVVLRVDDPLSEQVVNENTIYEVRYDFDLDGETLTVPEDCVLDFKGGSFYNGTLSFEGDIPVIDITESQEPADDNAFYSEHVLNNPVLDDVSVVGLKTNLRINGGKFSFNDENSDVIATTCCNLDIEGLSMIGTARYFINSTNRIVEGSGSSKVDTIVTAINSHTNLSNVHIVGEVPTTPNTAVSIFAAFHTGNTREIERPTKCTGIVSNCYVNTDGRSLSIRGLDNAEVIGGDFAGGNGVLVYSNLSTVITGGYYHDSVNGPIIGGTEGEYGVISNNIIKNVTNHGAGLDWAKPVEDVETPIYTYTDGYGIISGNVISDCAFPIFAQGKNLSISNNVINAGDSCAVSGNAAIRVNSRDTDSNDGISITDNIINCNGNNVVPIMVGSDTYGYVNGNHIINTLAYTNYNAGENGGYIEPDTYVINYTSGNVYIPCTAKAVVVESAASAFSIRVGYPGVIVPMRQFIVTNKSNKIVYIIGYTNVTVKYGNATIRPGCSAIVTVLDASTLLVTALGLTKIDTAANRPTLASTDVGYEYYDTTLKKPIYWNGSEWTDANGETLS